MTILRSGATKKYSDNWTNAFGKSKKASAGSGAKSQSKSKSSPTAKKKSVKAKK